MSSEYLTVYDLPVPDRATMLLGFSGWMDGGEVSTGAIDYVIETHPARLAGKIDPELFYLLNFPGSMEVSALIRPPARIEDGLVRSLEMPSSLFHYCEELNLFVFRAKEPNFAWRTYADCLFSMTSRQQVDTLCFVGSVAGIVPHSRAPKVRATVSDVTLLPLLEQNDIEPTNYEGPASFLTYLLKRAPQEGLRMFSLVVEIPAYIQGRNYKCIEAVLERAGALLDADFNLQPLNALREAMDEQLEATLRERPDLAKLLRRIEDEYDRETLDSQDAELREWFEKQGFRFMQ